MLCVSGQLLRVLDDFEKSLLSALDQFTVALHSDLRKASVSVDTLMRVSRQQKSTISAKVGGHNLASKLKLKVYV